MHSFRFRDVDIITSCGNYRCVCIKAVREALFVVMDFGKQSKLEKLEGKTLTTLHAPYTFPIIIIKIQFAFDTIGSRDSH